MGRPEDERVKIPALIHLTRLEYNYLSLKTNDYDGDTNIFINVFRAAVSRLNGKDYSESAFFCSEDSIIEDGGTASTMEREANHFATCLLMPEDKLRRAFTSMLRNSHRTRQTDFLNVNNTTFRIWCGIRKDLTNRYGVSETALRYRLQSLRLACFSF